MSFFLFLSILSFLSFNPSFSFLYQFYPLLFFFLSNVNLSLPFHPILSILQFILLYPLPIPFFAFFTYYIKLSSFFLLPLLHFIVSLSPFSFSHTLNTPLTNITWSDNYPFSFSPYWSTENQLSRQNKHTHAHAHTYAHTRWYMYGITTGATRETLELIFAASTLQVFLWRDLCFCT